MIATVLLTAHLLAATPAPDPFSWFGEDKIKHFFTSFVVNSFTASGVRLAGATPETSLWAGAGVAATLGLYKEISDARTPSGFSVGDLVWDFGGIAAATVIVDASR